MDSERPPTIRDRCLEFLIKWKPLLDLAVPSLFSALIVAAVIAQAVIYDAQRRIMNDTRQVIANQREEMNKQSGIMEKSLGLSERAYVGVASLKANLKDREVVMMLEDIGRIPANNVSLHAQEYRWTEERSTNSTTDFDAGAVRLFPGSFKMRIIIPLTDLKQEEITAIKARREVLSIGGTIQYEDGFGKNDATYFAFEYQPPPNEAWTARSSIVELIKRHEKTK